MEIIANRQMDEERALYGTEELLLRDCVFDGPADGESALKECRNIQAENTTFRLRYPCWHDHGIVLRDCEMTDTCRAPLWYSQSVHIIHSRIRGVKAIRECSNIEILDSEVVSPEFGWNSRNMTIKNSRVEGEYFMFRGENLRFDHLDFTGKYALQYVRGGLLTNCTMNTKDAFWHVDNLTAQNCVIRGEYLGWYSHNLTLINCTISGTQPFCYCTGLRLIHCRMEDTDLCFERSHVNADLTAPVISIKNPLSGKIYVPEVVEIIRDIPEARGEILVGQTPPAAGNTCRKKKEE